MHRNTYLASLFILKKDLYIKCCSCKDAWIKFLHLYAVTCQDVYLKLGFQQELVFMKPHTKTSMVLADTFWESMRMQYEMSTLFIFFKQAKITAPCWPYEYTSVCLMHINWVFSFSKHWITVLQLQDYMYMSNCCTGMRIMGYTNFLSNSWTSIFQGCQASRVNKYKERTLVHTLGNNCIISST